MTNSLWCWFLLLLQVNGTQGEGQDDPEVNDGHHHGAEREGAAAEDAAPLGEGVIEQNRVRADHHDADAHDERLEGFRATRLLGVSDLAEDVEPEPEYREEQQHAEPESEIQLGPALVVLHVVHEWQRQRVELLGECRHEASLALGDDRHDDRGAEHQRYQLEQNCNHQEPLSVETESVHLSAAATTCPPALTPAGRSQVS